MKSKTWFGMFNCGNAARALVAAAAVTMLAAPGIAAAQAAWPAKPIRVVVPWPAGGISDVMTRVITTHLATALGQPVVVENRPGADGNIGAEAVAKSPPDGYTWLVTPVSLAVQPALRAHTLRFDPVRDFVPVAKLVQSPNLFVVSATMPVNTLKEFVEYAKSRPNPVSAVVTGNGSAPHLATELFKQATGLQMLNVPYPGQPQAAVDLMTGRVDFMSISMPVAIPHIRTGKLKALAVIDTERQRQLPDVPTIVEAGYPDVIVEPWQGLFLPARTPEDIVQRVNAEVMKALQSPEVSEKLQRMGLLPAKPHRAEQFEALFKSDVNRLAGVIKKANITAN